LRTAAAHAQAVSEDAVGDLRTILDDALDRIKAEVFGTASASRPDEPPRTGEHDHEDRNDEDLDRNHGDRNHGDPR
jgi:hypothetical protein